jgi:hypothetical protein
VTSRLETGKSLVFLLQLHMKILKTGRIERKKRERTDDVGRLCQIVAGGGGGHRDLYLTPPYKLVITYFISAENTHHNRYGKGERGKGGGNCRGGV